MSFKDNRSLQIKDNKIALDEYVEQSVMAMKVQSQYCQIALQISMNLKKIQNKDISY